MASNRHPEQRPKSVSPSRFDLLQELGGFGSPIVLPVLRSDPPHGVGRIGRGLLPEKTDRLVDDVGPNGSSWVGTIQRLDRVSRRAGWSASLGRFPEMPHRTLPEDEPGTWDRRPIRFPNDEQCKFVGV